MNTEEPPEPVASPEPSTPPPEPPEVQALLQRYRERRRARRHQRRRRLLAAIAALTAGTGLLVAVISIGRTPQHQGPLPAAQDTEPPAVPSREGGETRAPQPEPSPAQAIGTIEPPAVPSREGGESLAPKAERSATQKSTAAATRETVSPFFQPRERLATVRPGDTKERVFELFGTAFDRRNGVLMRIEGMRLRASGRSPHHAQVEVAEVKIADTAAGSLYWFLFGDGQLVAWGRPEEWPATARRYQVEIDYQPDSSRTGRRG